MSYDGLTATGQAPLSTVTHSSVPSHGDSKISDHFWGKYQVDASSVKAYMPSALDAVPLCSAAVGTLSGMLVSVVLGSTGVIGTTSENSMIAAGAAAGYLLGGAYATKHNYQTLRPLLTAKHELKELEEAKNMLGRALQVNENKTFPGSELAGIAEELKHKGADAEPVRVHGNQMSNCLSRIRSCRSNAAFYFELKGQAFSAVMRSIEDESYDRNLSSAGVSEAQASLEKTAAHIEMKKGFFLNLSG
jgi:hypothetical protein